jgi:hypothetical protein
MEYLAVVMDLAWFTVVAVSAIFLLTCEIHRQQKEGRHRRAIVVLLALLVLFPSLSVRDDLMGLAFLSQRASQRSQPALESQAGSDFQLGIHLLALDHFLVTSLHDRPMNFGFAAQVPSAASPFREHRPLRLVGRAPPLI